MQLKFQISSSRKTVRTGLCFAFIITHLDANNFRTPQVVKLEFSFEFNCRVLHVGNILTFIYCMDDRK